MRWFGFSSLRAGAGCLLAVLVLSAAGAVYAADTDPAVEELRKASAAYAEAFTKGDFAALADQWTTRAELVEGGMRLEGREAIVESLKLWRARHPQATLAIELSDVEMVADPVFGIDVPVAVPDVPSEILRPRNTWKDKDAYDKQAAELARMFDENFDKYRAHVAPAVAKSGPTLR